MIGHDRRKILRINVTRNPNALWIVLQIREAWPYTEIHRFLLIDRDSNFGEDVVSFARGMGSLPVRTAFRSRWQNGVATGEADRSENGRTGGLSLSRRDAARQLDLS